MEIRARSFNLMITPGEVQAMIKDDTLEVLLELMFSADEMVELLGEEQAVNDIMAVMKEILDEDIEIQYVEDDSFNDEYSEEDYEDYYDESNNKDNNKIDILYRNLFGNDVKER